MTTEFATVSLTMYRMTRAQNTTVVANKGMDYRETFMQHSHLDGQYLSVGEP